MEEFKNSIKLLSKRIKSLKGSIQTEESTKMSLIVPFFKELGYDVYNPQEFLPEFTADVGIKKGEKVDYAIMQDGEPMILIEAKTVTSRLEKVDSQLFRYFGTTSAKFAILTNGEEYRFFTDLDERNKMDSQPFFTFNFNHLKDSQIVEIAKFKKSSFDLDNILDTASELKYLNEITNFLLNEFDDPGEDFKMLILSNVYEGRKTQTVLDKFDVIIKKSLKEFINELVSDKLQAAIKTTAPETESITNDSSQISQEYIETEQDESNQSPQISLEELEGYVLVKLLISELIEGERVFYRDNQSYFNVLLDDSIRKWICRLGFKGKKKYIKFNDDERTQVDIDDISSITQYKGKLLEVVQRF